MSNEIKTEEKPGTVDVVKGMFLVSCPFCNVAICCRMSDDSTEKNYETALNYIMNEISRRMLGHVNNEHFKPKADGSKAL